jgi:hypothetical protein
MLLGASHTLSLVENRQKSSGSTQASDRLTQPYSSKEIEAADISTGARQD